MAKMGHYSPAMSDWFVDQLASGGDTVAAAAAQAAAFRLPRAAAAILSKQPQNTGQIAAIMTDGGYANDRVARALSGLAGANGASLPSAQFEDSDGSPQLAAEAAITAIGMKFVSNGPMRGAFMPFGLEMNDLRAGIAATIAGDRRRFLSNVRCARLAHADNLLDRSVVGWPRCCLATTTRRRIFALGRIRILFSGWWIWTAKAEAATYEMVVV